MQEQSETCSICHRTYPITRTETWTTDDGTPVIVDFPDMTFAIITVNGRGCILQTARRQK